MLVFGCKSLILCVFLEKKKMYCCYTYARIARSLLFLTTVGGEVRQSQNLCDVVCDYPLSTVITKAKYSGDPNIQLVHQMLFVL